MITPIPPSMWMDFEADGARDAWQEAGCPEVWPTDDSARAEERAAIVADLRRSPTEITGIILTIAGLGFSAWARRHLGRYWSSMVMVKVGHQLIRTGPYRIVRNPIYTGIFVAFLGAAVAIGELLAFAALLLDYAQRLWPPLERVGWLSPFRYYSPFELVMGSPLAVEDLLVLGAIALTGFTFAYLIISQRDISR